MTSFIQTLILGLLVGALYALMASGLTPSRCGSASASIPSCRFPS
jgi:hypothetical protein